MNELQIRTQELPDSIEDLASYDRFLSARKPTYVKLLHGIKDWNEASEEEKRLLRRAQEEAEYLIDVRAKMGEITARMEKGSGGKPFQKDFTGNNEVTSKETQLSSIGLTKMQASRYETLSRHPEVIESAKEQARDNNELVTMSQILRDIKEQSHPHVSNNSRNDNEWYTPVEYLESARAVLGTINLDPASNEFANERVQAEMYYTEEDNGLEQEWYGSIWLNPPYSSDSVKPFAEKLINSKFDEAIVLVNNATETEWFNLLISKASAIVFPKGRIQFDKRDGKHGSPLQGQAFIYYGDNIDKFLSEFMKYGWGARLDDGIQ